MESKVVACSDLSGLCELLVDMAGDWELVLSAIGVRGAERDQIRLKHPYSPKLCLVEGLEQWLVTTDTPTYGTIIGALRGKTATNLPLATLVEELASTKSTTPVVLPDPCVSVSEATQQSSATTSPDPPVVVEAPQSETSEAKVIPPPAADSSSSSSSSAAAATKERPSFPHLPTAALSEHHRDVLEGRLSLQSERLLTQFGNLVYATSQSLKGRVEVDDLVELVLEHTFEPLKEGVCKEFQSSLLTAKSLREFFNVIRPYHSFFDYRLIELLVATFGTDDDKRRLAEYEEQLTEFCRRRVYECPIEAFGAEGKFEICLVAKLKDEFEKFELKAVKRFRHKLCDILGVPDDALRFIGAAEGCVEIRFAMFSSLESVIFPLSGRQRERLRGEGVLELRGGGHHCSLEGGESEQGPPLEAGIGEAAECGDTARVTALLGRGEPVDNCNECGESPLMLAARGGHTATVEALLAHGADINFKDDEGCTPLMEAAYNDHTSTVQSLVAAGAGMNIQTNYGWTALYHAACSGHTAAVEALVAAGADMNIGQEDGWTALMEAADNGLTATVQSLVAAEVDMNIQGKDGWTALYCAAWEGHTAAVEALVAAGADMNIGDKYGRTPLMTAAVNGHPATVQSLVAAGAGMNIQDNHGQTPLYRAAWKGHTAAVGVLVAAGADMNIGNKAGWTPLMTCAFNGHTAVVQSLVAAGAGMNIQDETGRTALTLALQEGESEVAEVLIKAGAGLSHQENATGWTALFFAAKEGHLPLVRLLLEGGAGPTHKDKEGVTAFDVAETYGHQSVMEELEKHSPAAPTARPVPSSSSSSQPAPTDPSTGAQQPTSPASSSAPPPPPPADDPQRTTVRARVFQAVRILAERFERLVLAGRAKKREEEEEEEEWRREGARPRQRSNKPGRGRRADRQQTESAESRNIRNISSS